MNVAYTSPYDVRGFARSPLSPMNLNPIAGLRCLVSTPMGRLGVGVVVAVGMLWAVQMLRGPEVSEPCGLPPAPTPTSIPIPHTTTDAATPTGLPHQ